jgi:hypothetical protein
MVKVLLIIVLVAILMENSTSIKKSEEEKKEDEEMAKAVNRTLAEEEKRREEDEKKKKKEEKTKGDDWKKTGGQRDGNEKAAVVTQKGQDEACPPANYTCPVVEPCPKPKECPAPVVCEECPEAKKCGPCPTVQPCEPCNPCNCSVPVIREEPLPCTCPGEGSMSIPVALAVGAMASLFMTGVATAIGLLLRYVPPTVSGFLFLAIIIVIWYLCSQYPDTARELGGRAVAVLREAALALNHRVMAAIQRHADQVGLS